MKTPDANTMASQLKAFRNAEEGGFDFYFESFYKALVYFSFRITNEKDVSADIASDAFIKLWERRSLFNSSGSIRSFLYTTVRNASIDHLRKMRSRKQESLQDNMEGPTEKSVQEFIIESETYRQMQQAVEALPPKAKEIIRMIYVMGEDYKEIAKRMNISINTVRAHKARALGLLRKFMVFISILSIISPV